jgi:hypothetical protein
MYCQPRNHEIWGTVEPQNVGKEVLINRPGKGEETVTVAEESIALMGHFKTDKGELIPDRWIVTQKEDMTPTPGVVAIAKHQANRNQLQSMQKGAMG